MIWFLLFILIAICVLLSTVLSVEFNDVECPADWSTVQSSEVKEKFDLAKMQGIWYEIAYHDLAQVRESCQFLNRTVDESKMSMYEVFGYTYPNIGSGGLELRYDTTSTTGYLMRYIDKPILRKIQLPCAIVDLTINPKDGSYETASEYLCYTIGNITYREIRILSRQNTMPTAQLRKVEQNMRDMGVPFKELRRADQSDCEYII